MDFDPVVHEAARSLFLVAEVIEQGWGEIHPLVPTGDMPPTLLMVFGPRNDKELEVVLKLISTSYKFARGM